MTVDATPKSVSGINIKSSQNRLLIKNGKVVNDDGMEDLDVYIEDGIIKQMGRNLIIPGGTRTIDASGKLVMPGGIDPHTHFELEMMGAKSADDFYKGTRAAVAGGTTCVIDFVLPQKGQSLLEAYANWREKADSKVCCDYGLHVGVTWWSPSVKKEMEQLTSEQYGVNSFKMFMAYKDAWMLDDYDLYCAMEACGELRALPQVHAENGHIIARNTEKLLAKGVTGPVGHQLSRDEEVEGEAVNRACVIANQARVPLYIVHIMSKSAVRALQQARTRQRQPLFGETLAATVGTDGTHYRNACFRHAAAHVLSPPLRPDASTPQAMCEALADDHLQLIGSDNCTFHEKEKELGKDNFAKIPNGVNGVEDRMAILWQKAVNSGIMDPCRFVAVTSANAAKIFNIWPQKGRVAVNSDADIVVWDPKLERTISAATHKQAVDFNIFEGQTVVGSPQYVIVNGRVCLDDGQLRVVEGFGKFVKTPVDCPLAYGGAGAHAAADALVTNGGHAHDLGLMESQSVSGRSTPTRRREREDGQADMQLSSFSISKETEGRDTKPGHRNLHLNTDEVANISQTMESASVSGCSTPTGRKMREPGQRNMQTSTFSISQESADRDTKPGHRNLRVNPGEVANISQTMESAGSPNAQWDPQTYTFSVSQESEDLHTKPGHRNLRVNPGEVANISQTMESAGFPDVQWDPQTCTFSVSQESAGRDNKQGHRNLRVDPGEVANISQTMESAGSPNAQWDPQTYTFSVSQESEDLHTKPGHRNLRVNPGEVANISQTMESAGFPDVQWDPQTCTFSVSQESAGDTKQGHRNLRVDPGEVANISQTMESAGSPNAQWDPQTSTFSVSQDNEGRDTKPGHRNLRVEPGDVANASQTVESAGFPNVQWDAQACTFSVSHASEDRDTKPGHRNLRVNPGEVANISQTMESAKVAGAPTVQWNPQTCTFSIKEDEGCDKKTSVRVRNPPGGKSSGLW